MALLEFNYFSRAIGVGSSMNIVLPQNAPKPWKTLILLHEAGGDFTSWLRNTSAARYAEEAGIALVMPDGYQSWYTDMKYGSFFRRLVGEEIPAVSREFCPNLSEKREDTFIAGAEMGGYGAWAAALTYPETFAGAFAFSPLLDPMTALEPKSPDDYRRFDIFGTPEEYAGSDNDLTALAEKRAKEGRPLPLLRIASDSHEPRWEDIQLQLRGLGYRVRSTVTENRTGWDLWDSAVREAISEIAQTGGQS